jgi:hypothetical protein
MSANNPFVLDFVLTNGQIVSIDEADIVSINPLDNSNYLEALEFEVVTEDGEAYEVDYTKCSGHVRTSIYQFIDPD